MRIKTEPIHSLLVDCDVAYTSAVTSAALDAYCAGVPVVSVRDPKTLNLSPLRDSKGVQFVSTPKELKEALNKVKRRKKRIKIKKSFFYVDKNIPRWKKFLTFSK
jgi:surface carbohydrate biosynthesis protein (TIGR04326 family)